MPSVISLLKASTAAILGLATPSTAQGQLPNLNNLPAGVPVQITDFGERASWSRDGTRIAFMSKTCGDAYEFDLSTGKMTLMTTQPSAGWLRAQYLPNDDLLLIGTKYHDETFDILRTRTHESELFVLPRGSSEPVPLNTKTYEGFAVSIHRNRIAWGENWESTPDVLGFNESALYTSDIVYDAGGVPSLANKQEIRRASDPECQLEVQDFRTNDTEVVFNCYPQFEVGYGSDVYLLNLETNETTPLLVNWLDEFNESEGISPFGDFILIESDRDNESSGQPGHHPLDIWRLNLEPPYDQMERLTFFANNPPARGTNPVVSPDGKIMAFQIGRVGSQAGRGFGIMLMGIP